MSSINNTIKVIGSLLIAAVLWQGYLIYSLNNSIKSLNERAVSSRSITTAESYKGTALDPFREFQIMQQELERTLRRFNSFFANDPSFEIEFDNFSYRPLLDMTSNSDGYVIKTDIPGVEKSNIDIKIEKNSLRIKAEVREAKDSNSTNFISKERYIKKFERTILIPQDADTDKLKSEYKDGVLTITIPKK